MAVDDWRDRAACTGRPDADWFPRSKKALSPANRLALAVCATCPVRQPCLDETLGHETARDRHGIYGGLLASQRGRIVVGAA